MVRDAYLVSEKCVNGQMREHWRIPLGKEYTLAILIAHITLEPVHMQKSRVDKATFRISADESDITLCLHYTPMLRKEDRNSPISAAWRGNEGVQA